MPTFRISLQYVKYTTRLENPKVLISKITSLKHGFLLLCLRNLIFDGIKQ